MEYGDKFKTVAENLRKSQKVNSYDDGQERESDTLAHAILDMEESFREVLKEIPNLSSKNATEEDIDETLFNIGEQLRHILYHIRDPKFYKYISEG